VYSATSVPDNEDTDTHGKTQTTEDLYFCAAFFQALELRAQAFEQRLRNEIRLVSRSACCSSLPQYWIVLGLTSQAYHTTIDVQNASIRQLVEAARQDNMYQGGISVDIKGLLEATKADSVKLAQFVSLLSMLFLPGSFVTVSIYTKTRFAMPTVTDFVVSKRVSLA
jgi:hypothetical protein